MTTLPENPSEAMRVLEEEAIAANTSDGRTDHYGAARHLMDNLGRLEAGGITWARHARDHAELDGLVKRLKARIKSLKRSIPTRAGNRIVVPAAYSRRNDDGSVQLTLWYELPLSELAELIDDIAGQAKVLTERSLVMRYGLELAIKHDVNTAADGFRAEGLDIVGEAAA